MRSALFFDHHDQPSGGVGIRLVNSMMLKINLDGECMARAGTVVAYQGRVRFQTLGTGGANTWLRSTRTGQGAPVMKINGRGSVFLADRGAEIQLIDLDRND